MFLQHENQKNFPQQQIVLVTKVLMMAVCIVVLILSIIFYNGPYGNLEVLILRALKYILLFPLSILLRNEGGLEQNETTTEEITTTETEAYMEEEYVRVSEEQETIEQLGELEGDAESMTSAALFLMMALYIVMIAGILLSFYAIHRYWKKLRSHYIFGEDEMEAWEKEMENPIVQEEICYQEDTGEAEADAKRVRFLYKKQVLGAIQDTSREIPHRLPEKTALPEEISRQYLKEEKEIDEITRIYEKARYSEEKIKEEEMRKLKELIY